jgi:probable rRNA maturation factor
LIDVEIEDDAWRAVLPDADEVARGAAEAALAGLPSGPRAGAALVVLLTGDEEVADLNLRFRGKPGPTNVLSFPAPDNPEGHLGDIALAYGVCRREAEAQNKLLEHHLQHLVVHGVLHLVGFDHMTDAEAVEMEGLERAVLAGLGTPDPYAAEQGEDG